MFSIFHSGGPSEINWWHIIHILSLLDVRSNVLALETLSTGLALVKSTWLELWSQSSPEAMKSFRFLNGNKNSIFPKSSFHISLLKISSQFTTYFKSH